MFVDHARIHVKAGDGGRGCMAFRREKYVPRGGPSGGDGGKGGDVYLKASPHLNTLVGFRYRQHYRAQRGGHGSGNNRHGHDGEDRIIEVPIGTQVFDEEGRLLCDFEFPNQLEKVASGGRGGRGNAAFASSTNQAPRHFEEGRPGQERVLVLELKLLADVGLVGAPNAGKSTLISVLSKARPRIAEYPFTTLTPHLGVVPVGDYSSFVVADIPGLIEGAHTGTGLGCRFLRHIERTRLLVHLVDISGLGANPVKVFQSIRRELGLYNPTLTSKPVLVVASKLDAAQAGRLEQLDRHCREEGLEFSAISAVSGEGIEDLKHKMAALLGIKT